MENIYCKSNNKFKIYFCYGMENVEEVKTYIILKQAHALNEHTTKGYREYKKTNINEIMPIYKQLFRFVISNGACKIDNYTFVPQNRKNELVDYKQFPEREIKQDLMKKIKELQEKNYIILDGEDILNTKKHTNYFQIPRYCEQFPYSVEYKNKEEMLSKSWEGKNSIQPDKNGKILQTFNNKQYGEDWLKDVYEILTTLDKIEKKVPNLYEKVWKNVTNIIQQQRNNQKIENIEQLKLDIEKVNYIFEILEKQMEKYEKTGKISEIELPEK